MNDETRRAILSEQQTPTPIDPADIRPGDLVDVIRRVEVDAIDDGYLLTKSGGCLSMGFGQRTFRLVHRPDPDAEVIEAVRGAIPLVTDGYAKQSDKNGATALLRALRDCGFDVVKRAET